MFTLPERFTSKYVVDPTTGCHVWTAMKQPDGYGRFRWEGRMQYAHRVAYAAVNGDIPAGMQIDHICNRPSCVNPEHLQAVTKSENERFKVTRDGTHHMANRTHCPRGHELSAGNTCPDYAARGWRKCLTCNRERVALVNALASALGKAWDIRAHDARRDPRVREIVRDAWSWSPATDAEAAEMSATLDACERIERGEKLTKRQKMAAVYRAPA